MQIIAPSYISFRRRLSSRLDLGCQHDPRKSFCRRLINRFNLALALYNSACRRLMHRRMFELSPHPRIFLVAS